MNLNECNNLLTTRNFYNNNEIIPKNCEKYITEINKELLDFPTNNEIIAFPSDFNIFLQEIQVLVNTYWNSDNIDKRCTFNSPGWGLDEIDLFNVENIRNRQYINNNNINEIKNRYIIVPPANISNTIKQIDNEVKYGFGNSIAKDNLNQIITDFNTIHLIGSKKTRIRFIKLILDTFNKFNSAIYDLNVVDKNDNRLDSSNLNIILKGGIPMRFIIKELIRNFDRNTENFIYDNIKKNIKFSDYDFEIVGNPDINIKDKIKINILSYLVILKLKNYIIKHHLFFFDFFELNNKRKSILLTRLQENLQEAIVKMDGNQEDTIKPKDTITLRNGDVIYNFYKDIVINYITIKDLETQIDLFNIIHYRIGDIVIYRDSLVRITNIHYNHNNEINRRLVEDLFTSELCDRRYDIEYIDENAPPIFNVSYHSIKPDLVNYINPDINNDIINNNDISMIVDGNINNNAINTPNVSIRTIKSKNLLDMYGIQEPYLSYCNTNENPSDLYTSHNPLITNYLNPNDVNFTSFNLNRIKYKYTIYFTKTYNEQGKNIVKYYKDTLSGEILDLSSKYNNNIENDIYKERLNSITNKYIKLYEFRTIALNFYSYSLYGLIKDLRYIIFTFTNNLPWEGNIKYTKRIERYVYLIFLYSFTNKYKERNFKNKIKQIYSVYHIIESNFANYNKVFMPIDIYRNLLEDLYNVYITARLNYNIEYIAFKNLIIRTLNIIIKIFTSQYLSSNNLELSHGKLNDNLLEISDGNLYSY
jgi:hypothetical protein